MQRKNLVKKITEVLVSTIFYIGIAVTISVPLWGSVFYKYVNLEHRYYSYMTFMLLVSGACAVYILYNLKAIFKTLNSDPFVAKNIKGLLNMGKVCFVIFAIYVVKLIFLPTLATVIIIVVFGMAGLFCLTIKDLFQAAVQFKQDNDMTI